LVLAVVGLLWYFTWLPRFSKHKALSCSAYQNTLILALSHIPGYMLAAYLLIELARPTLALYYSRALPPAFYSPPPQRLPQSAHKQSTIVFIAWRMGRAVRFSPELYPTDARTTGMGWVSAMARLASIFAPS
jgi:putative MFS transporter